MLHPARTGGQALEVTITLSSRSKTGMWLCHFHLLLRRISHHITGVLEANPCLWRAVAQAAWQYIPSQCMGFHMGESWGDEVLLLRLLSQLLLAGFLQTLGLKCIPPAQLSRVNGEKFGSKSKINLPWSKREKKNKSIYLSDNLNLQLISLDFQIGFFRLQTSWKVNLSSLNNNAHTDQYIFPRVQERIFKPLL